MGGMAIAIFVLIIIIMLIQSDFSADKEEERLNESMKKASKLNKLYEEREEAIQEYAIPAQAKELNAISCGNQEFYQPRESFLWMNDNHLNVLILPIVERFHKDDIIHKIIKYDDIAFHFNAGELHTENKIEGGGGGGADLGGAAVGGLFFGGAGAIIGSQKKIDPVTSKMLVHDKRETVIKYLENDQELFMKFKLDTMHKITSLIPHKQINQVFKPEEVKSGKKINQKETIDNRLRKLKKLWEEELITDNEYAEKKSEIFKDI